MCLANSLAVQILCMSRCAICVPEGLGFRFGEYVIRFMSRLKLETLWCGFCAAAMFANVFTPSAQIRRMRNDNSICGVFQVISPIASLGATKIVLVQSRDDDRSSRHRVPFD